MQTKIDKIDDTIREIEMGIKCVGSSWMLILILILI